MSWLEQQALACFAGWKHVLLTGCGSGITTEGPTWAGSKPWVPLQPTTTTN